LTTSARLHLSRLPRQACGRRGQARSQLLKTLDSPQNSRALIEATINLAHALGLQVVAEGVEEAETLATLTSLGCDLAQCYYIAKPTAAADLTLAQHLVA
jgi:EAL domain-containing protein (putative c-di-GMP-specific phosphodiesterase class I)